MAELTPEESRPQAGERAMFWAWILIIAAGLAVMITLPMIGR